MRSLPVPSVRGVRHGVVALALLLVGPAGAALSAQPLVIAHRGLSWRAPEHTLLAYRLGLEAGADFIEQDLQLTADGRLLVLHDETGARTLRGDGCEGPVRARPAAHWLACDASRWFADRAAERAGASAGAERPVLLDTVLARFPQARFYIETKAPESAPGMEDSLVALLTRAGLRADGAVRRPRVLLQSFSAASLLRLRALAPEVPRVQLLERGEVPAPTADDTLATATALDRIAAYAAGIGPSRVDVTPRLVAMAHARCLVVHPYTVNDAGEMQRLLEAGVDGMFSDRPDVLRHAVAGRPAPALPAHCTGR
jgi:glycerophosphoryl diester phosphodiesterase